MKIFKNFDEFTKVAMSKEEIDRPTVVAVHFKGQGNVKEGLGMLLPSETSLTLFFGTGPGIMSLNPMGPAVFKLFPQSWGNFYEFDTIEEYIAAARRLEAGLSIEYDPELEAKRKALEDMMNE